MRKWMKKNRMTKNLTQKELADLCNIKRTTVTEIENGKSRPSVEVAKSIANVLGFDWTKFYEEKEENDGQKDTADKRY